MAGDAELPSWGEIDDLPPRMLMIALIMLRDDKNCCEQPQESLADFMARSTETVRQSAAKLEAAGFIRCETCSRSVGGNFGGKRYQLLDHPLVEELIRFFDPRTDPPQISVAPPARSPSQGSGQYAEYRNGDFGRPPQGNTSPPQETGRGHYKESRERGRASQSFILHSLPEAHGIEDDELARQVSQALAACGEGTLGVETSRLIESLAYHIPRALQKGFSFEKDIIPCIGFYTRYWRPKPLNRFDVTFRHDLPEWRNVRLRRAESHEHRKRKTRPSSSMAMKETTGAGEFKRGSGPAQGTVSRWDQAASRASRLRRVIQAFDSGGEAEMIALKFELPVRERDLFGQALVDALRPIVEAYRQELATLSGEAPRLV